MCIKNVSGVLIANMALVLSNNRAVLYCDVGSYILLYLSGPN